MSAAPRSTLAQTGSTGWRSPRSLTNVIFVFTVLSFGLFARFVGENPGDEADGVPRRDPRAPPPSSRARNRSLHSRRCPAALLSTSLAASIMRAAICGSLGSALRLGDDSQLSGHRSGIGRSGENVADAPALPPVPYGRETRVWGDQAYRGQKAVMRAVAPRARDSPTSVIGGVAGSMRGARRRTATSRAYEPRSSIRSE